MLSATLLCKYKSKQLLPFGFALQYSTISVDLILPIAVYLVW